MSPLLALAHLVTALALLPRAGRDPLKVAGWLLLLVGLGLSAVSPAPAARLLAAAMLALLTLDAALGRAWTRRLGLALLTATFGGGFYLADPLWLWRALLLVALAVFGWREWQQRPGAGWLLLSVSSWLLATLLESSPADPVLTLAALPCVALAVNKQLRLTPLHAD